MGPRSRISGWFATLLICCSSIALPVAAFAASVSTNKTDYVPGETVVIHGAGWRPGEAVSMVITESPVAEQEVLQATADASGSFTNAQFAPDPNDAGQEMLLTATGTTSGTASTIFAGAAANLDQGKNETPDNPDDPVQWVNGNLNDNQSHYTEGMSIPYRMVMTGLTNGSHTLIIGWDTKDGDLAALDYLTHYQRLEDHAQFVPPHSAETVNPLLGLGGPFTGPVPYTIPTPSTAGTPVVGQPATSFGLLPAGEKVLSIWNGTITGASYNSQDPLNTAHAQSELTINFTSTDPTVVVSWGGHIARKDDWNDLAHPTGSPYHTRLIDLDGSGGNQDRSLKSGAVLSCEIDGPSPVCAASTNQYCVTTNVQSPHYSWTLTNNTSGASFTGPTNGSCVNVSSGTGGSYSLKVAVTNADGGIVCEHSFTVNAAPSCSLDGPEGTVCPGTSQQFCGPAGAPGYLWTITGNGTIQGSATSQCVTIQAGTSCDASYTVSLKVSDGINCNSTCSRIINVKDTTAPAITGVGPEITIQCPAQPVFSDPEASDNCSTPSLTHEDSQSAGACAGTYTVTRTWTAKDACNNTSTASQVIHVVDTTKPTFVNVPNDATVECSNVPPPPNVTATDTCDPDVHVELAEGIIILDSNPPPSATSCTYEITRTWTATDDCGNTATASQKLTVKDTQSPQVASCPADKTIECPATPDFGTPSFTDNCDTDLTVTSDDVRVDSPTCANAYDMTRTWTAKDNCNNQVLCSQTIHVVDTTAPALACPADITVGACEPVTFNITAPDACGGNVDIVANPASGSSFPVGTTTVNVTATDACGNQAACSFKVNVTATPIATITGDDAVCDGKTTELCGPDGNFSWAWTGPGTFTADTRCITVGTAGTYKLTLTDLAHQCTSTGSHDLTVNPIPVCSISGPTETCQGAPAELCGPDGNYGYAWSGPGSFTADTRCITVSVGGSYSLMVTDLASKCASNSCSHELQVNPCVVNCPRTPGFWAAQCDADGGGGKVKFDSAAMTQITECVDAKVGIFSWAAGTDFSRFCSTVSNGGQMDQRRQAKRQFASFLANMCTGELGLIADNGDHVFIDSNSPVSCSGLSSTTMGGVVTEVDNLLLTLESQSLTNPVVKAKYSQIIGCLDAINNAEGASVCQAAQQENALYRDYQSPAALGTLTDVVELYRPSPNPFSSSTRIAYVVRGTGEHVHIGVYDVSGRRMKVLTDSFQSPGRYELSWDGSSDAGGRANNGVYFVRSVVAGKVQTMRVIYVK